MEFLCCSWAQFIVSNSKEAGQDRFLDAEEWRLLIFVEEVLEEELSTESCGVQVQEFDETVDGVVEGLVLIVEATGELAVFQEVF